jgi:importin subunit beta-1
MALINSEHDKPAKLAIELWSTFAEVELSRITQNRPHQAILSNCLESIIEIILTGLRKFDQDSQDENLDEMPENSLTLAAGYTLENITRVVGNFILSPLINFIQSKIISEKWGDRYIALIAFGSIIDGPDPQ